MKVTYLGLRYCVVSVCILDADEYILLRCKAPAYIADELGYITVDDPLRKLLLFVIT